MTASHSFADLLVKEKPEVITPKEMKEFLGLAEEKPEVITPLDLGESSLDLEIPTDKQAGAFPPFDDTVIWWNNIDWDLQRERARGGVNNVGLVLAIIGTKLNDLGTYLSKV